MPEKKADIQATYSGVYDPSFTTKELGAERERKTDQLFRFSTWLSYIEPKEKKNVLKNKANIQGTYSEVSDPSLTTKGRTGVELTSCLDSVHA